MYNGRHPEHPLRGVLTDDQIDEALAAGERFTKDAEGELGVDTPVDDAAGSEPTA